MPDPIHTPFDRWRVLIPRRHASEVLVLAEQATCHLPEVRVPQNQRLAWHLNAALKHCWQLDVVSIPPVDIGPHSREDGAVRYHVAELLRANAPLPGGMQWASVSSLTPQSLPMPGDFSALRAFLKEISDPASKDAPFGHLGWLREVTSWFRDAITPLALEWNGRFEQFHASASFSLMRLETAPRAAWFKAVGEPNTREFRITLELANRYPEYVPRILAVRPDWNAWLAEECPGKTLDQILEIDLWRNAARALAGLQIESLSRPKELLRAGAHNLDMFLSQPAVEQFLAVAEKLVSQNPQPRPIDPTLDDLSAMTDQLRELLEHAEKLRVPNALGHLDLNAGNVIVSSERCAYLDWAEAYVGLPFLTFEYFLQQFRRAFGQQAPRESAVVETYLAAWEQVLPRSDVREAWALTPALAVFAYALRCVAASEPYGTGVPRMANYLRTLLRKLKRELENCTASKAGV
jgi:Phosphotransferase enzyme family